MSADRRTVAIYRDSLLAISETFIAAQGAHLARYAPLYVGTSRCRGASIPVAPALVLEDEAASGTRMFYRLARRFPRPWVERISARAPALVHAHFGPDAWLAIPLARALGVPLVATFHGYDVTIHKSADPRMHVYRMLRPSVFRNAARIISPSDFLRRRLIEAGCPEAKLARLYIGVDVSAFRHDERTPREPVVLFVGRLVEKKGCAHLVEAMRRVAAPGWKVVVIGDGPLRRDLERHAGDNVVFVGQRPSDEVRNWMSRASIFCVPSLTASNGDSETLGIVFLEAQSMGLPVVSYAHGGIPEAVTHEETGILAPEKDVDALARALQRLIDDAHLRNVMGRAGRARVEREFDIGQRTAELERLYDEVAMLG